MSKNGKNPSLFFASKKEFTPQQQYFPFSLPSQWRYPDKPIRIPLMAIECFPNLFDYYIQMKFNGWRCLLEQTPNGIRAISRNNKALSLDARVISIFQKYKFPVGTLLDGELMTKKRTPNIYGQHINIFDIQKFGIVWLGNRNYSDRLELLKELLELNHDPLVHTYRVSSFSHIKRIFKATCELSKGENQYVEGLVLKHMNSHLVGDRNRSIKNPHWFKVLCDN